MYIVGSGRLPDENFKIADVFFSPPKRYSSGLVTGGIEYLAQLYRALGLRMMFQRTPAGGHVVFGVRQFGDIWRAYPIGCHDAYGGRLAIPRHDLTTCPETAELCVNTGTAVLMSVEALRHALRIWVADIPLAVA